MAPRFPGCDTTYLGKGQTYGPLPDHGYTNLKVVLHTSETVGMPGFGTDGSTAPHYVYDATNKDWYIWADVDRRVGTLKGHSTNHANDDAFQVEILGYSDGRYDPWVGDFTDDNYQDLADFYAWAMTEYPIDRDVTPTPNVGWIYGSSASTRGTESQYNTFSGLSCHGWGYGNSHYDVGVLDLQRIHDLATQEEPDMPTHFQIGDTYDTYEEITWLLYQAAGGTIDPNLSAARQIEPVLGKTDVKLVTREDFDTITQVLNLNQSNYDLLIDKGLYRFGKEIAALRSLTYD